MFDPFPAFRRSKNDLKIDQKSKFFAKNPKKSFLGIKTPEKSKKIFEKIFLPLFRPLGSISTR